jgi:hypothetical protein
MPTSSIVITRPGRRLESGRRARAILISLLAAWLSAVPGVAAPAGEPVELSEAQVHAAQIRARTTVCGEEAPAERKRQPWRRTWRRPTRNGWTATPRSPRRRYSLCTSDLKPKPAWRPMRDLRQRLEKELRGELEAQPEAFAEGCNAFFNDLTAGALDYP